MQVYHQEGERGMREIIYQVRSVDGSTVLTASALLSIVSPSNDIMSLSNECEMRNNFRCKMRKIVKGQGCFLPMTRNYSIPMMEARANSRTPEGYTPMTMTAVTEMARASASAGDCTRLNSSFGSYMYITMMTRR